LKSAKVRIFTNVHSSGHASLEDIRDFITMVKPMHIIPSQGNMAMESSVAKMAEGLGYKLGENIHIVSDGQRLKF